MSRRTSPPNSLDDIRGGLRTPEDDTIDMLRKLRDSSSEQDDYPTPPLVATINHHHHQDVVAIPEVVARVLASPEREELTEVARMLDRDTSRNMCIVFHTAIGDIRCRINWRSCDPSQLRGLDGIFFIKMRSSDVAFTPRSGATFEIGFSDFPGRFNMVCLSPPQQLYPGVDLMCFLPHNSSMEKNGKVSEGAPSVVSGKPSDSVDTNGEPVVDGEKSAATVDFDRIRGEVD